MAAAEAWWENTEELAIKYWGGWVCVHACVSIHMWDSASHSNNAHFGINYRETELVKMVHRRRLICPKNARN